MTYFVPHNVQNPLENCAISFFFLISPYESGRGIALTKPCPQENRGRNVSPLSPQPVLPYIINIPINRSVTLNNLLRGNSSLCALL